MNTATYYENRKTPWAVAQALKRIMPVFYKHLNEQLDRDLLAMFKRVIPQGGG